MTLLVAIREREDNNIVWA